MQFHQHTLPNGLTILAELNPAVHSVSVGYYVRAGARDETPEISGVSHFLEHMAFKGDDQHSADDVNRIFDEIGARYNASTGEEITQYYAVVLPEFLDQAVQLLSVLMTPTLRQDDFDVEKKVILEEIGMYDDQPAFRCYDLAMATYFRGHPLGRSILGTQESITALPAEEMRNYHRERYVAGNMILVITGNADWTAVLQSAEKYASAIPSGSCDRILKSVTSAARSNCLPLSDNVQEFVMGMGPAPDPTSTSRYAAELLAVITGDDQGSRLFWDLVDPGHAESADMSYCEYEGAGTWLSYLSCQPEQVQENLSRINSVFASLNADGVSAEEVEQAQNKVASRVVLRSERPMGRMSSLGNNWLYRSEYRTVSDDLRTIRDITVDQIRDVLDSRPPVMSTVVGVGPLTELPTIN